jgi:type 1 glutamine amidotransferase
MLTPSRIKASALSVVLLACLTVAALGAAPERRVLVYTKNQVGKGLYVHDNIPASVATLKKLGAANNFAVDVSDDPASFTDQNLKRYQAVIFDNTNNEVFDNEEQKTAFQRYIRAGGGFVGIHSATGSMRQWPWFWSVVGGKFSRHAKMQKFTVIVKDPKDASTAHLPATFEWTDEFYYVDHMPSGLHVLLAGDLTKLDDPGKDKYPGKMFGDEFPLAWRHEFDGGREWYTALGHKPEHYSDPRLTQHLLGGILWAMGESK